MYFNVFSPTCSGEVNMYEYIVILEAGLFNFLICEGKKYIQLHSSLDFD